MSQYKLTYFNMRGIGEPIRWAFKVSNVDFEDERIEFQDWPAVKENGRFPTGHVPLLQIDGQVYTQSGAILKYIAKKYGLTAGDELQDLRVEQAHDFVNDGVELFRLWFRATNKNKGDEANSILEQLKNLLHSIFKQISSFLEASEGNFLLGSKLTYGDLILANWFQIWAENFTELSLRENWPHLAKLEEAVLAIPQIKAWIEVRPKSQT